MSRARKSVNDVIPTIPEEKMLAKNNNVHISDDGIEAQDDNLERKESCEHRFIG